MLERVITISNVGRFRNSAAAPNPQFARHTVLFGPNGYGKTTLCAVLRSLERGEPHHIAARRTLGQDQPPSVNLLWDGQPVRFAGGAWSRVEERLSIFDGTYVAENVHSGDVVDITNRRNLYRVIVGRNGVALARREQELAEEGRAIQQRLTAAERALEPLLAGIAAKAFAALPEDPHLDGKLSEARAALNAHQQAAAILARASLVEVRLPELPASLRQALLATLPGVDVEVEQQVAAHIERHRMGDAGEAWLARGAEFAHEDDCPFCGREDLQGVPLIRAYRVLFSDGYAAIREEVENVRAATEQQFGPDAFGELRATAIGNSAAREFWAQHCDLVDPLPALQGLQDRYRDILRRLHQLLGAKAARPLQVADVDDDLEHLSRDVDEVRRSLDSYNQAVRAANDRIDQVRARVAAADERAIRESIANLERVARRHGEQGRQLCEEWRALAEAKAQNTTDKAQIRRQLEEHCRRVVQPYETSINRYLRLFNAGFSIVGVDHAYPGGVATCTYQLRIEEVLVPLGDARAPQDQPSFKTTLSAGDRTTLALAFFLAELEREEDLPQRVVVFDDPFNSQDAYRRRNTIHEIMAVARTGAQIVVLSHDASFLKEIWKKSPHNERASLQLVYHPTTGTKLVAFDMENACQGRAQQELDDLLAFRSANVGEPRDIIKKLRVVLETHFREMYPAAFEPGDNFGVILRKIREGGAEHPAAPWYDELDRINDYTQDYHHGEDPRGAAEPPLDRTELRGFVDQTLRLANAVVG
jgi:wobble nucleotide-excising tRNase